MTTKVVINRHPRDCVLCSAPIRLGAYMGWLPQHGYCCSRCSTRLRDARRLARSLPPIRQDAAGRWVPSVAGAGAARPRDVVPQRGARGTAARGVGVAPAPQAPTTTTPSGPVADPSIWSVPEGW